MASNSILSGIKNIIFDLGGVLLEIDHARVEKTFEKLGLKNFREIYSHAKQQRLFDDFEMGKITSAAFRANVKQYFAYKVTNEQLDSAWNSILVGMPKSSLELLQSLKGKYRLFVLSNTNEIHLKHYAKLLQRDHGVNDLAHLVEKEYYSSKLGKRKPDSGIFNVIVEENRLVASETLFVDDTREHIDGAEKAGLRGFWVEKMGMVGELSFNMTN